MHIKAHISLIVYVLVDFK